MGVVFGFWYAYVLFDKVEGVFPFALVSGQSGLTFALLTLIWGFGLFIAHDYVPRTDIGFRHHVALYLKLTAGAMAVYTGLAFFLHWTMLSRLMVVTYAAILFLWMCAVAYVVMRLSRAWGSPDKRLLIVPPGDPAAVDGLIRRIRGTGADVRSIVAPPEWGLDGQGREPDAELASAIEGGPLDMVMLHPDLPGNLVERCISECQLRGIAAELLVGPALLQAARREMVETAYGSAIRLLPYQDATVAKGAKRLTDFVLSLASLLILLLPMLVMALLVAWTSPGPVLFAQERVGLNGRRFRCLKFRTMVQDADKVKDQLLHRNEMSGPVFKMRDDPRVTKVGRWLRKYSLDELPQLVNVLVGEMSIVGPRPPLPDEVEQYETWQRRRLSMRPGLTCLWQIRGRNEVDFEDWMRLDLQYIDEWSYLGDWWIILKTFPAVLSGRGAS